MKSFGGGRRPTRATVGAWLVVVAVPLLSCGCRRQGAAARAERVAASSDGASAAAAGDGGRSPPAWVASYRDVARRIIAQSRKNTSGWRKLTELCDDIGHRLSGSPALDRAIDWAAGHLRADGHENVRKEPVQVPKWTRGRESLVLTEPRRIAIPLLGLGRSVGTGPDGITAPVVVVDSEKALDVLGRSVRGKIVLFDNPMPPYDPKRGSHYGTAVRFRVHGARLAADRGALAVLVRSVTPFSLRTPHTGSLWYGKVKRKIPAAAIPIEDAALLARFQARGKTIVARLEMEAKHHGMVRSHNVIGELRGREKPDEIVVIGGHIDSWDVGQGAHDDGGGCVAAMEALTVLRRLGLRPRRTIRVVLWTNEENGLRGAKAYAKRHAAQLSRHVAAIESDSGIFAPRGFALEAKAPAVAKRALAEMQAITGLLASLGPLTAIAGSGGADVSRLRPAGVPLMSLRVEGSRYFHYHHTAADTLDKVDPKDLQGCIATLAVAAYVIADAPVRLGGR